MTSLAEAYEPDAGYQASPRQLAVGAGLFLLGSLLVVGGIVAGTTDLLVGPDGYYTTARLYAGTLAGLGVPAVFLGVFAVLPSARLTRAASVIGASIAVVGVALFWHAYPCQWVGSNCANGRALLTLPTVAVYSLGMFVTFWCLFAGVANFQARNDPRGTVTRTLVTKGETTVVEVPESRGGLGGVGLLGAQPDGEVETQTNAPKTRPSSTSTAPTGSSAAPAGRPGATVSDGGASASDLTFPNDAPATNQEPTPAAGHDAVVERRADSAPRGDTYCGNCAHFQYAKDGEDGSMVPYCTRHAEPLEEMTACEEWTTRGAQSRHVDR